MGSVQDDTLFPGTVSYFRRAQPCLPNQERQPRIALLQDLLADVDCGAGEQVRPPSIHGKFDQAEFQSVLRHHECSIRALSNLSIPLKQSVSRHESYVKLKLLQYFSLFFDYLFSPVGVICDVHEVVDIRRIDLLVLGRYQHACHSDQLVVLSLYQALRAESVDQVYAYEQRFWQQFVFEVDVDEPIYQCPPHFRIDFLLQGQTVMARIRVLRIVAIEALGHAALHECLVLGHVINGSCGILEALAIWANVDLELVPMVLLYVFYVSSACHLLVELPDLFGCGQGLASLLVTASADAVYLLIYLWYTINIHAVLVIAML